jgi:hypothetical protein
MEAGPVPENLIAGHITRVLPHCKEIILHAGVGAGPALTKIPESKTRMKRSPPLRPIFLLTHKGRTGIGKPRKKRRIAG